MTPQTGWAEQKEIDPEAFKENIENQFPMGRMGTPKEVADVITFIRSENASFVS